MGASRRRPVSSFSPVCLLDVVRAVRSIVKVTLDLLIHHPPTAPPKGSLYRSVTARF